jgi:UDP-2-acetamido-3-amino-2,3-dideoxy-glucuronate N-acetyltransferase
MPESLRSFDPWILKTELYYQKKSPMKFISIADDVQLGKNVKIFNFVNLYGCRIGDGTKIGTFVEIQKGVTVGKNCKISSHTFICEGVHIGDGCFIGHGVLFINDKDPRAVNPDGSMQTDVDWTLLETFIEDRVSIGSGAIIMGGIRIGKGALIGAGAVVTRDVAPRDVVAGVPARVLNKKGKG